MNNSCFEGKTALILAPHTDDGELSCGATISKLLKTNCKVVYVAFSICKDSVPKGLPEWTLRDELGASMCCYGIVSDNVVIFDYPVRLFSTYRQDILDDMIKLNNRYSPDIVFAPSLDDVHQDHSTIARECMRAFKRTRILGYELPWNNYSFNNQCFSIVDGDDVNAKVKALTNYKSQANRIYFRTEYTKALMMAHGVQAGAEYAEAFEVVRWIL